MMNKIGDLKFIDLGLPSKNKVCFDLVDNLYSFDEIQNIRSLLPTMDEIREILLYANPMVTTKVIQEKDETKAPETTRNGLSINTLDKHFFIPFLGEWSKEYGTDPVSCIFAIFDYDEGLINKVSIDRSRVKYGTSREEEIPDSYYQIILIMRGNANN